MAKNQRRYTDDERASLIVMLQSEGYPDKVGALKKVADYAGVHENVLRRWWRGTFNPPPTTSVSRKKLDLKKAIDDELTGIFSDMKTARKDADYRALGTVAGILMDKKFLLEGKPTERIEIDLSTVEAEIMRRIEAGDLDRAGVLSIVEDERLADKLFAGAAARVSAGKQKPE